VTWRDLASENYSAAQVLFASGHFRACTTRSYYAVYCAITDLSVTKGVAFKIGWNNPSHNALPGLLRSGLALPVPTGMILARYLVGLRMVREDADYRPAQGIDQSVAADALREASLALSHFGLP
jgi:uncharacterized protein (UPF0332 family)